LIQRKPIDFSGFLLFLAKSRLFLRCEIETKATGTTKVKPVSLSWILGAQVGVCS
jgi:hypothetical protein